MKPKKLSTAHRRNSAQPPNCLLPRLSCNSRKDHSMPSTVRLRRRFRDESWRKKTSQQTGLLVLLPLLRSPINDIRVRKTPVLENKGCLAGISAPIDFTNCDRTTNTITTPGVAQRVRASAFSTALLRPSLAAGTGYRKYEATQHHCHRGHFHCSPPLTEGDCSINKN